MEKEPREGEMPSPRSGLQAIKCGRLGHKPGTSSVGLRGVGGSRWGSGPRRRWWWVVISYLWLESTFPQTSVASNNRHPRSQFYAFSGPGSVVRLPVGTRPGLWSDVKPHLGGFPAKLTVTTAGRLQVLAGCGPEAGNSQHGFRASKRGQRKGAPRTQAPKSQKGHPITSAVF